MYSCLASASQLPYLANPFFRLRADFFSFCQATGKSEYRAYTGGSRDTQLPQPVPFRGNKRRSAAY